MRGIPSNVLAGYVLLAVVWTIVLVPLVRSAYLFFRTTHPRDLVPRIRRIPAKQFRSIRIWNA